MTVREVLVNSSTGEVNIEKSDGTTTSYNLEDVVRVSTSSDGVVRNQHGLAGVMLGASRLAPQSVLPQNVLRAGTLIHSCATAPDTVTTGSESKVTQDTTTPTPWGTPGFTKVVETTAGGTVECYWDVKYSLADAETVDMWLYVDDIANRADVYLNMYSGTNPNYSARMTFRMDSGWNNIKVPVSDLGAASGVTLGDSFTRFRVRVVSAAGKTGTFGIGPLRVNAKARPAILFTFDDSYRSDYLHVYRIFKKYGYAATSYLIPSVTQGNLERALTVPQILEMQSYGWTFGFHDALNWVDGYANIAAARASVVASRKWFQQNGIKGIRHASYPENRFNDAVVQMLKDEGVRYCRSVIVRPQNSPVEDLMKIRAIGLALDAATNIANIESALGLSQALWINGHEVGYQASVGTGPIPSPEMLEEVVKYCADRGYPVMSADEWARSYEQGCVI